MLYSKYQCLWTYVWLLVMIGVLCLTYIFIKLKEVETIPFVVAFSQTPLAVHNLVDWNQNGESLAIANDNTILIWESSSNSVTRSFQVNNSRNEHIVDVRWSLDGDTIAVLTNAGTVTILAVSQADIAETAIFELQSVEQPQRLSWISDDAVVVISTQQSHFAQVWRVSPPELQASMARSSDDILNNMWDSRYEMMTAIREDSRIEQSNLLTSQTSLINVPENHHFTKVAYSTNGELFAIASSAEGVFVWDSQTTTLSLLIRLYSNVNELAWSFDDQYLAIKTPCEPELILTSCIMIVDVSSGELVQVHRSRDGDVLNEISWRSGNEMFAVMRSRAVSTVPQSGMLELFAIDRSNPILTLNLSDPRSHFSWSPKGDQLVTTDPNGEIRIWDFSDVSSLQDK